VRLRHEPLELVTAFEFRIAHGTSAGHANTLVRIEHEGLEGLGEASPAHYYGERRELVERALELWAPRLGEDPFALEAIERRLRDALEARPRRGPRSRWRSTTGSAGSSGSRCGGCSASIPPPRRRRA